MFKEIIRKNKLVFFLTLICAFFFHIPKIFIAQILGFSVDSLIAFLRSDAKFNNNSFLLLSVTAPFLILLSIVAQSLLKSNIQRLVLLRTNAIFLEYLEVLEDYSFKSRLVSYNDKHLFSLYQNTISVYAQKYVNGLFNLISFSFLLLFSFSSFLYNHWSVFLMTFTSFILLFGVSFLLYNRVIKDKMAVLTAKYSAFTQTLVEVLRNFSVLYYSNRPKQLAKIIASSSKEQVDSDVSATFSFSFLYQTIAFFRILLVVVNVLFVLFLAHFQVFSNVLTIGTAIVVWNLLPNVLGLGITVIESIASMRSVRSIKAQFFLEKLPKTSTLSTIPLKRVVDICFENLTLILGQELVFKNLNLFFKGGRIYGIKGPSGCGKTSLARILTGYHRNYQGTVRINLVELKQQSDNFFRENVAYCGPDLFVFDASIKDNITLFKAEEDISEVCEISQLEELEPTSSRATQLSAGQKQRVILARGLFENKPLIIFDESFANLDKQTLLSLKRRLKDWKKQRTILVISHHISEEDDFFDEVIDLARYKPQD